MNTSTTASTTAGPPRILNDAAHYKIGIGLALLGNFLIAVSLNIQKCAHRRRSAYVCLEPPDQTRKRFCGPDSYLRSAIWWTGLILMIIGEVGNFVAYGFAPASVVAPLASLMSACVAGCLAVIANAVMALLFNKESLRMRDIFGATFAVVGSFLIVQFSEKSDKILDANQLWYHLGNWQFILYTIVELVVFGIILFVRSRNNTTKESVVSHLLLVAILGSFTVICAKGVSGMLAITIAGNTQLVYVIFYVMLLIMAVTTIAQLRYLNQAMKLFDIAVVVPINFALFTISAIMAGAIFYEEFFHQSGIEVFMFLFGCCLSLLGVIFITGRTTDSNKHEEGSLHLDMMPNFIRSMAVSLQVQNVQPKPNAGQSTCYPDEDLPIFASRRSSSSSQSSSQSQATKERTLRGPNYSSLSNGKHGDKEGIVTKANDLSESATDKDSDD